MSKKLINLKKEIKMKVLVTGAGVLLALIYVKNCYLENIKLELF